jgi:chromosome segregation ATPase
VRELEQENSPTHEDQEHSRSLKAEIGQLQQQLLLRDQLVEQLSTELFRLIRAHPPALLAAEKCSTQTSSISQVDALGQELQMIETQIAFYQDQIDKRDAEIAHLQASCQGLSDRNQMLELVIQDLPEVYRQKFSDRLAQVKTKVRSLELENRRLYDQLQTVQDPLAPQQRDGNQQLSLPSLHRQSLERS